MLTFLAAVLVLGALVVGLRLASRSIRLRPLGQLRRFNFEMAKKRELRYG